jgi:hypothetical protein
MTIEDPLSINRRLRAFHLPVPCFDAQGLDVPTASGRTVEAIDGRIASVVWTDVDGVDALWVTHSIVKTEVLAGSTIVEKKVVRWYKIGTNGWPAPGADFPELLDWGEIDAGSTPVAKHLFFPSISVNDDGDVAIIMARTSSMENLSIQATGRFAAADEHTVFPLDTIKLGNSPAAPNGNNWGDYFTVVPDPSGDGTFWGFGSYMIDNVADSLNPTPGNLADDGFGTWIFHFELIGP